MAHHFRYLKKVDSERKQNVLENDPISGITSENPIKENLTSNYTSIGPKIQQQNVDREAEFDQHMLFHSDGNFSYWRLQLQKVSMNKYADHLKFNNVKLNTLKILHMNGFKQGPINDIVPGQDNFSICPISECTFVGDNYSYFSNAENFDILYWENYAFLSPMITKRNPNQLWILFESESPYNSQ